MRVLESLWIGRKILEISDNISDCRLLNVGSSTKQFREIDQPQIQENVFEPLLGHCRVDHLDIKASEGVDIIGDLTDSVFLEKLKTNRYDVVLCSNLLEHVINPVEICNGMEDCVKKRGYILVTVPCLYPYHNDPIDTMFRPDIEELQSYFKNSSLVEGEIITMSDNHFKVLLHNKKLLILTLIRWLTPFYKFDAWKKIISDIPNTFKPFKVTCILMQKNSHK